MCGGVQRLQIHVSPSLAEKKLTTYYEQLKFTFFLVMVSIFLFLTNIVVVDIMSQTILRRFVCVQERIALNYASRPRPNRYFPSPIKAFHHDKPRFTIYIIPMCVRVCVCVGFHLF